MTSAGCMVLDDGFVAVSAAGQRTAILLLVAAIVGLIIYAIDATVTHDPGPPPRGKP